MSSPTSPNLLSRAKELTRVTPESLSHPVGRFWAHICYNVQDHGFLRIWWTNLVEISPGVWRSNQPGPKRLAQYAKMGIKDILILRGVTDRAQYQFEVEAAEKYGIRLHTLALHARRALPPSRFLTLLDYFERMEKPWLMHCKSGSDRAGLAAAIYMLWQGRPLEEARKQLSFRYFHLKSTSTGILDVMLDHYEEALEEGPISIRDWLETGYDANRLREEFAAGRRHGKSWPAA
ncbi:MAG: protein tyrosine phosphatase [Pseudomonadota bacterium]